ncbi:MAG: hypothetical protein LLF94_07815 [Chlamydiales bacterium]|nr:hypothetical protein [Chlamydiales bacterium]
MTFSFSRICLAMILSVYALHAHVEPQTQPEQIVREVQELSNTTYKIPLNGKTLEYNAICGTLPIESTDEKPQASLYFTAYFKKQSSDSAAKRPLMFCFNGGPGSSSVWLHMGLLGPKKVVVNDATFTKPPATYADNPYTLLDTADLVFIDPVSTGFSKIAQGADANQFHSVEGDTESFADFIRLFLTHFHRWQSPKYLMGESYGTIRAISLANYLHDVSFIDMNGIILVSMCLDFQAYDFGNGNDLPYIVNLPTYAACAWYHKKLPSHLQDKTLEELLKEVEHFAIHDYATALLLGDDLDKEAHQKVVRRLADYTGLRSEFIRASHLRVVSNNFYHELLKSESKVIGRFDGRYVAYDTNHLEEPMFVDPSFDAITGPFTSAFNQYLYEELKIKKTSPYYILNANAVFPWNFSVDRQPAGLGYLYMSGRLRTLIEKNPSLNVLVLSGIYDLATPYFAANHSLKHLKLDPSLRNKLQVHTYEAGHMMYLNPKAHAKIKSDLVKFLNK